MFRYVWGHGQQRHQQHQRNQRHQQRQRHQQQRRRQRRRSQHHRRAPALLPGEPDAPVRLPLLRRAPTGQPAPRQGGRRGGLLGARIPGALLAAGQGVAVSNASTITKQNKCQKNIFCIHSTSTEYSHICGINLVSAPPAKTILVGAAHCYKKGGKNAGANFSKLAL